MTIGLIDDGIGVFSMYYKLKQSFSANYICKICDGVFPFGKQNYGTLYYVASKAIQDLTKLNCDFIVISSVTLSMLLYKKLSYISSVPLYSSEAPVLHASAYTASGVLVAGDSAVLKRLQEPNVIACAMDEFPLIAEECNERAIVEYITERVSEHIGSFDCIALASSSMNMFKHCFSRVCPNAQIFDSLEGVARRIRKKYKKTAKEESSLTVLNQNNEDITKKYSVFYE